MDEFYQYPTEYNKKPKKTPGFKVALIVVLMVVCLALGALLYALFTGAFGASAQSTSPTSTPANQNDGNAASTIGGQQAVQFTSDSPVVDIAEQVGDSVVSIAAYSQVSNSSYSIMPNSGGIRAVSGTGVIITEDGYILTNNHIVEGATKILVTLHDGTELQATLTGGDSTADLAVLKVEQSGLRAAKLGDSSTLKTGEMAICIGDPLGAELAGSVSMGIISAPLRTIQMDNAMMSLIQTDAAINPGNSGGPLVNSQGEVVGITTMKKALAGYNSNGTPIYAEGLGFAIPINDAKPIAEALIHTGKVERPGIGITGVALSEKQAGALETPQGIYVSQVTEGGSAAQAGIASGDVLTKINGQDIESMAAFTQALRTTGVGNSISITYWRQGAEKTVDVQVMDLNSLPQ